MNKFFITCKSVEEIVKELRVSQCTNERRALIQGKEYTSCIQLMKLKRKLQ